MNWKVETKQGVAIAPSKEMLPPLEDDFVVSEEYERLESDSVGDRINDRLIEELGVILEGFKDFDEEKERNEALIRKNDLSVKNLRGQLSDHLELMRSSFEAQKFMLQNQKNMINRSDIGRNEKRRQISEVQERIDEVKENLEKIKMLEGDQVE